MKQLSKEQMEKLAEIFNDRFGKPYLEEGMVSAKVSEPEQYKGDPHLLIYIGRRDIAIDKYLRVTGSGTSGCVEILQEGDSNVEG